MPAITATSMLGGGVRAVTETTLNGTDSLTFITAKNPVLTLRNPTAGALSPTVVGSTATTVDVAGIGSVSVASGYAVGSIAAGALKAIPLNTIKEYLKGNITITSGTGLVATLEEY
jgi:hypothetical protein